MLVAGEGGAALSLTMSRAEGALRVEEQSDGTGALYCVAPDKLLPVAEPEGAEIAGCIAKLSAESFELEPEPISRLVDPAQLELVGLVQKSCRKPSRESTNAVVEELSRLVGRSTLRERQRALLAAVQAAERSQAGLDGALRSISQGLALSCEQAEDLYLKKCPGSCLELQAQYAAHCLKTDPASRLTQARDQITSLLAQVRRELRRQRTLVLVAEQATHCATDDVHVRLRGLLGSADRPIHARQGGLRCELTDIECGISTVQVWADPQ